MEAAKPRDLLERTFNFARDVLEFCSQLPSGAEVGTIKRQLVRSAASVGGQLSYRLPRAVTLLSRVELLALQTILVSPAPALGIVRWACARTP